MYHTLTFSTALDFALFSQEVGSWWYELATLRDVQKGEHGRCHAIYSSETAIGKEHQIDIQGCPMVLLTSFNNESRATATETKEDNDEIIPLDSQLGQDASALLAHYFPGAAIASIQSIYSSGYFAGDYTVTMVCAVTHPIVQQVKMGFMHEDVPGRPKTWRELCSLRIDLWLTSFTLLNKSNGHPMTYALPGMYQPEIEQWCKTPEHGQLYGHIKTPDLFIITTEGLQGEELKRALLNAASDFPGEETKPVTDIPPAFRQAFGEQPVADPAINNFDPFLDSDDLP